jgi:radical SAM protein with 4Fe4S-binding SPASM domain
LINHHDLVKTYLPTAIKCAEDLGIKLHVPEMYLNVLGLNNDISFASKEIIPFRNRLRNFIRRDPIVRDCLDPWNFFYILQSGSVRPCCVLEDDMGNLVEQTFENIWYGDKYKALRHRILSNNPPEKCITCPIRPWTRLSNLKSKILTKNKGI